MKSDVSPDVQIDLTKEGVMLAGTIMIDTKALDKIRINTTAVIGMQVQGIWSNSEGSPILEKARTLTEIGVMTGRELMIACKRQESALMLNLGINEVGKTTGQQTMPLGERNNL